MRGSYGTRGLMEILQLNGFRINDKQFLSALQYLVGQIYVFNYILPLSQPFMKSFISSLIIF